MLPDSSADVQGRIPEFDSDEIGPVQGRPFVDLLNITTRRGGDAAQYLLQQRGPVHRIEIERGQNATLDITDSPLIGSNGEVACVGLSPDLFQILLFEDAEVDDTQADVVAGIVQIAGGQDFSPAVEAPLCVKRPGPRDEHHHPVGRCSRDGHRVKAGLGVNDCHDAGGVEPVAAGRLSR